MRAGVVVAVFLAVACTGQGEGMDGLVDDPAGATPAPVEESRVLEVGTSIVGELEEGERLSHLFFGTEGQHVRVSLTAVEGSWDTFLRIYSPEGDLLVEDDDGGDGLNSLAALQVVTTGRHRAEVAGYNDNHGGKYRLTLALDRPPGEGEELLADEGRIDPGNLEGSGFGFEGMEGATVTIAVNADAADLDPVVTLYGPDRQEVGRDDDGGDGYNSLLTTTLPETGTYVAVVTGFSSDDIGPFRIRVTAT